MKRCERCDQPVTHGNLCAACVAYDIDYEDRFPEPPAYLLEDHPHAD